MARQPGCSVQAVNELDEKLLWTFQLGRTRRRQAIEHCIREPRPATNTYVLTVGIGSSVESTRPDNHELAVSLGQGDVAEQVSHHRAERREERWMIG